MPETVSNIEIVNQLDEQGLLKPLVMAGIFPSKVLFHRDVYYYMLAQKKMGIDIKAAIVNTEEAFKIKQRTIYYIMARFGNPQN